MKLTLECPNAEYQADMTIRCKKAGDICAHQYFKACKGWWALSDGAATCALRKEQEDGQRTAATARRGDAV